MHQFRSAFLVLIAIACSCASAHQMVNVAIATGEDSITINGDDMRLLDDGDKEVFKADRLNIVVKSGRLIVNGKSIDAPLRLLSDKSITTSGKTLRGELDVLLEQSAITLVHPIELEEYVAGIVAAEVPKSWPLEALKAQAIAARTYALKKKYERIDKSYHLDSTVLDQVYGGRDNDHALAAKAAEETRGLVLTYESKLVVAFFSSACGGETASALEGWGYDIPYLKHTTCGYCARNGAEEWKYKISKKAFEKAVGADKHKHLKSIKMGALSESGRTTTIDLEFSKNTEMTVNVIDLRQKLGYSNLKSTVLQGIDLSTKDVTFRGRGYGHGVGMCQWGAHGMAQKGIVATEILSRYYPGTELRRIY